MVKIAFILDPLLKLNPKWDTSLTLASECQSRGWKVDLGTSSLFWKKGELWGRFQKGEKSLSSFDCIWMRKEPPVDSAYLSCCQMLLTPPSFRVINSPLSLIAKNEKLFALEFSQYIPPTLVTSSQKECALFLKKMKGKMVIKPLNERGGRGVMLVQQKEKGWKQKIKKLTQNGKKIIVAQKFLKTAIADGSKRVLFLNGKILGVFQRIPVGPILNGKKIMQEIEKKTVLTKREKTLCQVLSKAFLKWDLFFVGVDLIEEKLIEINITSPAGIVELNRLYGKRFEKKVIDEMLKIL